MESVQKRADSSGMSATLKEIENLAIKEIEMNCNLIQIEGKNCTKDYILSLRDSGIEDLAVKLGRGAFVDLTCDRENCTYYFKFNTTRYYANFNTLLLILNYLEKMDGAINRAYPVLSIRIWYRSSWISNDYYTNV